MVLQLLEFFTGNKDLDKDDKLYIVSQKMNKKMKQIYLS